MCAERRNVRIPRQPPHLGRLQPNSLTARQAELLDEIEALYLAEGFGRHTLDALAAELRCSKMTLYTLAPSREQLAVAVLRRFFDRVEAEIVREVRLARDLDTKLERSIRAMATRMLEMSDVCFHELISFEPTQAVYAQFARGRASDLAALLDDAGRPGRLPGAFTAEVVKLAIDSLCAREFEAESGIDPEAAIDHLVALTTSTARPPRRATRPAPGRRDS
jgi:AcrR family transcriptional regulator